MPRLLTALPGLAWLGATACLLCPGASAATAPFTTTAPMAYMIDLGSGRVLFAKNEHRRFPPASLAKIMTAHVAFERIDAGKLRLDQMLTVSEPAAARWKGVGSSLGLAGGDRVSVETLLLAIMTASANDASVVLAEGIAGSVPRFAAMMNAQANTLGLRDSHFATPNGWPDGRVTQTSAADLATLASALVTRHPALYRRLVGRPALTWRGVRMENHIPTLGAVRGADGVKTGFTGESGYGYVGSAVRGGRRLVMVLAGMDSEGARAEQSRAFLNWGFDAWTSRRLVAGGEIVAAIPVQQGEVRSVGLRAPAPYFLTTAHGEPTGYRLAVRYRGPLKAPIRKGQQVGELVVTAAGQGVHRLPLVAARDVAAAGLWGRVRNGLLGLIGW